MDSLWAEGAHFQPSKTDAGQFSVRVYEDAVPSTNLATGLDSAQVDAARAQFGFNEVAMHRAGPLRLFASKFVGFTPCALELTIVAALALQSWPLAGVVAVLLVLNAVIGFAQEMRSRRAVNLLQESLQMVARCLREGEWVQLPARELVPGDVVRLRHGDVVPADVSLVADVVNMTVDQSALTGESDAFAKTMGAEVFGGSIVKTGEAVATVVGTGTRTKFGASIRLVSLSAPKMHIERVMFRIVLVLMIVAALFLIVGIVILVANESTRGSFVSNIPLFLSMLISAIPAALPAMFSLTMALGSQQLARNGVLVTRLSATEDAASMDMLCTDKTGTLTSNQLSVVDCFAVPPHTREEIIQYAALACKKEDFDAIDGAILQSASQPAADLIVVEFQPFSAATRKTVAVVAQGAQKVLLRISKGAVDTLLKDCAANAELRALVTDKVSEIAANKGFRSIAVALDDAFMGVLFFADPPRATSQAVVDRMHQLGVRMLMLTGDALHIAQHVAQQVGLGGEVRRHIAGEPIGDTDAGFAEIFPEDKHAIVAQLQAQGHVVGMTGDGVNDAAALKQAEVGIAMSNATDVAKSAASAVFLTEGLVSMPTMVSVGRQIHARLRTWIINKIVKTFQTIGFIVLMYIIELTWIVDPLNLILLVLLVDFVTLAISTDTVSVQPTPCRWRIVHLGVVGVVLGFLAVGESIGIYYLSLAFFPGVALDIALQHTLCFEILLFFGIGTVFIVREQGHFYDSFPSWLLLTTSCGDVVAALLLSSFGVDWLALKALPVQYSFWVLGWACCSTFLVNDTVKWLMFKLKGLTV